MYPRWKHQNDALSFLEGRHAAGLFMEQRTGKSRVIVEDAQRLYLENEIEAVVIVAPNGVHRNWLSEEFPLYLEESTPRRTAYWAATPRKAEKKALEKLLEPTTELRVLTMNLEAVSTKRAFEYLTKFLKTIKNRKVMIVVDESYRIKTPTAAVSKALQKVRELAKYRRILNGTPTPEGPLDLYGQLEFLGDEALPVRSFVAFSNRYAEFLPATHPLVADIMRKNPMIRFAPRIVATNPDGTPRYRNLDELKAHVTKWCFRVTRRECREDLPEKIFKLWQIQIPPVQEKIIVQMLDNIKNGLTDEPVSKLNAAQYYQRLVCGWMPSKLSDDGVLTSIFSDPLDNPRIQACVEIAQAYPGESIVFWARYTADVESIAQALERSFPKEKVAMYYGKISNEDRESAKKSFQEGTSRFFVGQAAAGGVGLPLYKAGVMVYHSCDFKLFIRLQSEDRAEHMNMERGTVIIDLVAPGTIDERIISALREKKDVADLITGDEAGAWMNYTKGE